MEMEGGLRDKAPHEGLSRRRSPSMSMEKIQNW